MDSHAIGTPRRDVHIHLRFTFDEQILALIFDATKLNNSDSLLGLSDVIYPTDPLASSTAYRPGELISLFEKPASWCEMGSEQGVDQYDGPT